MDVEGIDNHRIADIRIVTAGALVDTNRGPIILIMNQYTHAGKGKTIHSRGQMEWFKNTVDDRSKKIGGSQRVTTTDGYIIPIRILSGLPYIKQRPYTDHEYDKHPHIFLTSDNNWNPSVLDYDGDDDTQWYDTITDMAPEIDLMLGKFENIHQTLLINCTIGNDYFMDTNQELEAFIIPTKAIHFKSHKRSTIQREPDYPHLRRFFGYLSSAPRHRFVMHMDAKQTANSSAHSRKTSAAVAPRPNSSVTALNPRSARRPCSTFAH
jgi:hypothetical protein